MDRLPTPPAESTIVAESEAPSEASNTETVPKGLIDALPFVLSAAGSPVIEGEAAKTSMDVMPSVSVPTAETAWSVTVVEVGVPFEEGVGVKVRPSSAAVGSPELRRLRV